MGVSRAVGAGPAESGDRGLSGPRGADPAVAGFPRTPGGRSAAAPGRAETVAGLGAAPGLGADLDPTGLGLGRDGRSEIAQGTGLFDPGSNVRRPPGDNPWGSQHMQLKARDNRISTSITHPREQQNSTYRHQKSACTRLDARCLSSGSLSRYIFSTMHLIVPSRDNPCSISIF